MLVAILALVVAMSGSAYAIQRAQSGDSLIAKRTLSGNRLRINTVTGTEVADLVWHPISLTNGWTNYYSAGKRPPAWALDVQGVIHLRGAIQDGSTTTFGRLPQSVRPSAKLYIVTDLCAAAVGRITVDTDGFLEVDYLDVFSDATCFTNLEGVTWAVR